MKCSILANLEFRITVLPFEPQCSQKVEDEPHIHQSVLKWSYQLTILSQKDKQGFTLKISNLLIAYICQESFTQKRTYWKMAETIDVS